MARQGAISIQNQFIKGLITENTALNFPEDACTDTINCVFNETGRVKRRPGLDLESGYSTVNNVIADWRSGAVNGFIWDQVAGTGNLSFFVQQVGDALIFYDISSSSSIGTYFNSFSLATYKATNTPYSPSDFACQFAQGNSALIVTNPAINPIYITYSPTTQVITPTAVTIRYRDYLGLVSGISDGFRPGYSIATMKTDVSGVGPKHFYNLLNQGWWQGAISAGSPDANSAMGQWDTARTDMPSNYDTVAAVRASFTDAFDASRVDSYTQGTTVAPKGHFILDLGNADRAGAVTGAGYTLSFTSNPIAAVNHDAGSVINLSFSAAGRASDGNTLGIPASFSGTFSASATAGTQAISVVDNTIDTRYVGKDFGSLASNQKVISSVTVYAKTFAQTTHTWNQSSNTSFYDFVQLRFELYGRNGSAPSNATAGTLIGTSTVISDSYSATNPNPNGSKSNTINTGNQVLTIASTSSTPWRFVWVRAILRTFARTYAYNGIDHTATSSVVSNYEADVYELAMTEVLSLTTSGSLPGADVTFERPSVCAFFAGRAWYGGTNGAELGNNLYFSQVIQRPDQYGRCYQQNDPTSEANAQVLPTDGGIIKIPEMGRLVRMFVYQTALLLIATNGVWIIRGSGSNVGFTATSFAVRKISASGSQSPQSIVDVRGTPTWWGEDGILELEFNPQFDSYSVKNISDQTIRTFFTAIPADNRRYVKGAYDARNSVIYWIYDDTGAGFVPYVYTKALCLNTLSNAFYPWEFSTLTDLDVRGIFYSYDSIGTSDPTIKISMMKNGVSLRTMYFMDLKTDTHADYATYAIDILADITLTQSFDSYFITGYKLDGQAMRFVQNNYLTVFLEQDDNSSCYVQSLYDFTNSAASGKWSSKQQIYNSSLTNRNINHRRLKMRGKGRSAQFKFSSTADAPFSIIGWAAYETVNTEL